MDELRSKSARARARVGGVARWRAVAVLALALTLGMVGTAHAVVGDLQIIVSGALGVPFGSTGDGEITLAIGTNLPVSLVSAGVSTWPATVGHATFAQWTDLTPTVGFGRQAELFVFRLGGGFTVMAAGIDVPASGGLFGVPPRFVTTFSATSPAETLSGTWTIDGATSLGVVNAGPTDAVITFHYDSNSSNTIFGVVPFVAQNALPAMVSKPVPGVATVGVTNNVPVFGVVNNALGPRMGTLTSYAAFDLVGPVSETVDLSAIDFGGVHVLYGCAFPGPGTGIVCLVGGGDSAAHLSGHLTRTAGQFTGISGVTASDLLLTLTGSLP